MLLIDEEHFPFSKPKRLKKKKWTYLKELKRILAR